MMTVEQIRQKIMQMHAKTRQALLGGVALAAIVIGVAAYGMGRSGDPAVQALCALLIAWSLAGQYFLNREMWPGMGAGVSPLAVSQAALGTGLETYRREVERRRHLADHNLLWSFGPIVAAIGTFVVFVLKRGIRDRGMSVDGALLNMIPFLALLVVWVVAYFAIRMRDRRELEREINQLSEIEKTNR